MFSRIKNYFTSSYEEMRKVIWPNRQEVTSHTIIVFISILVAMSVVVAIDYGLFNLLQMAINRK